jgi:O-glycosyl hydrolase
MKLTPCIVLLAMVVALLAPRPSAISAQAGITVTIDASTRFQVLDGFGTCLAGTEAEQAWWQNLYYDDAGASILRVDLTPQLKSPYADFAYTSPWFHGSPSLPGPENNNVRTYTGPNDYARSYAGRSAPIAVMTADIAHNIGFFDYGATLPRAGIAAAKAGIQRTTQLGDFKLVGSLWSPVPWVKESSGNSIQGQSGILPVNGTPWPFIWGGNFAGGTLDVSGTPLSVFNDGTQNTSSLTQFARSTAAYILGYQRQTGTRFYAISIQNELNFEQFYNSATYPQAAQYITALKAIRAEFDTYPELQGIKLMGPEDLMGGDAYGMWQYGESPHKNLQYLARIAADPQAAAALSFVNIHGYASDGVSSAGATPQLWEWWANGWDASPAPNIPAAVNGFTDYGKKSWMTETSGEASAWLDTLSGFPGNGGWSIALKLQQALTTGQQSAWIYWQLSDGSANSASTLTDATLRENAPKYVAFKHFSKYIRPNAQRVAATVAGSSTLSASAYVHDAQKSVTAILVNSAAAPQRVTLRLPAVPSGMSQVQTIVSSDDQLWQTGTATVTSGLVTLTVPGYGVATLYGEGRAPGTGAHAVYAPSIMVSPHPPPTFNRRNALVALDYGTPSHNDWLNTWSQVSGAKD